MKPLLFFAFATLLSSCKHNTEKAAEGSHSVDTVAIKNFKEAAETTDIYRTRNSDTIVIPFKDDDTLFYTRDDIDSIRKYYPEIDDGGKHYPNEAYELGCKKRRLMNETQRNDVESFASEAGRDRYYMLYAYFLKDKSGIKKYHDRRHSLIEIFRDINDIHAYLNHGGTYFGHQYKRIEGYAEYAVRLYANNYPQAFFEKSYSIKTQKNLFIKSLKQFIVDEAHLDASLQNDYTKETRKKLFGVVEKLDALITDHFYLKEAQEFEYSYYE
jgi:hypothetical protein